jgi:hypothetical protein
MVLGWRLLVVVVLALHVLATRFHQRWRRSSHSAWLLHGCRAGPEILEAGANHNWRPSTTYIKINVCVYIILYKNVSEANKYMNHINYFYRTLHFNIYEIILTVIIKTYLILRITL